MKEFLLLKTSKGNIKIELLSNIAPKHCERIKELSQKGAYDGVVFHRVIDGFMAQTGDVKFGNKDSEEYNPNKAGMGSSENSNLKAEFSKESHKRGIASMARSSDPNSANSQFFICFDDAPWLDGQYSVWGRVVEGMDVLDQLKKGEPVIDPDYIEKASIITE